MRYSGIELSIDELVTILVSLDNEADRRKEVLECLRGTECEELAQNQYDEIINVTDQLKRERDLARERMYAICEVESLAES